MSVFRVEKTRDYTIMANHHLKDRQLSLKAKGLLSVMLSLPEEWDYTLKGLARINREGVDAIRECIRELERAGYIVRTRRRNAQGHLKGMEYVIYERPQPAEKSSSPQRTSEQTAPVFVAAESEEEESEEAEESEESEESVQEEPMLPLPTLASPALASPILENPTLVNPTLEKPALEEPMLENPTQLNTNIVIPNRAIPNPKNKKQSKTQGENPYQSNPYPIQNVDGIRQLIRRNVDYDVLTQDDRFPASRLDEIVDLITETLCSRRETICVAGNEYPAALVRERLLRLNSTHVEYVLNCMNQNTTFVRNIKKYLLAALFNAPGTIDSYYAALVNYDQYGGTRASPHYEDDELAF